MNLILFYHVKLDFDDFGHGYCHWEGNILLPDGVSLTEEIIIEAIEKDREDYEVNSRHYLKLNCIINNLMFHEVSFRKDTLQKLWVK